MQKIVINSAYGGFGLSHKAIMRYAELKGMKLYYKDGYSVRHYSTEPIEDIKNIKDRKYFDDSDIKRDDPVLVQVVEELGEEANGDFAYLKVVEIPDDVDWIIEEYDGCEQVAEKHRTWY